MLALLIALLASAFAFAADVDPVLSGTVQYVDQSDPTAGTALGSASQTRDLLRLTWHAAKGPEKYDAVCVYVQTAAPAGSVAALGLYDLTASDLPDALIWEGVVATDSAGLKCATISSGTVYDASFFATTGGGVDYLELFSADKVAKGVSFQGASTNARIVGATSAKSYGRYDGGGAIPAALLAVELSGASGALPASASGATPSSVAPPAILLRKL